MKNAEPVELHDRLGDLRYPDDVKETARVKERLRFLAGENPGDSVVAVALVKACVLVGDRAGANAEIERMWRGECECDEVLVTNMATLLAGLGHYDRARSVLTKVFGDEYIRTDPALADLAVVTALAMGDLDWIREINGLGGAFCGLMTEPIIAAVEGSGLEDRFRAHQAIVHDVLGPHQCHVSADWAGQPDATGATADIVTWFFVPGSDHHKAALERDVFVALNRYYKGEGLPGAAYVKHFVPMVTNAYPFW